MPSPALHPCQGSLGRHSPWGRGGHRGLGILGGLVHPETQPALRMSPAGPVPRCHPSPASPLTHHRAGDPSQAVRPRFPWGPLGADGASLPRRAFQAGFPLQGGKAKNRVGPACRHPGPPGPGCCSGTPRASARAPDTPKHPQISWGLPPFPTFQGQRPGQFSILLIPCTSGAPQSPATAPTMVLVATTVVTAALSWRGHTQRFLSRLGAGDGHHSASCDGVFPGGGRQSPRVLGDGP